MSLKLLKNDYDEPDGIFDESSRKPTDKFWLIPFIVTIISFIVVGVLAATSDGFDGVANQQLNGPTCGFDSNVLENHKSLYVDQRDCRMSNQSGFTCPQPFICVKSCPVGSFDSSSCTASNFPNLKEKLVCQSEEVQKRINNCDELQKAVQLKECAAWYNETQDVFGFCISADSENTKDILDFSDFKSTLAELKKVIPILLFAILIAIVISFIFIVTLKWAAGFVFWSFVSIIMLGLVGSMIASVVFLSKNIEDQPPQKAADAKTMLYASLIILSVILLVFILLLWCCRRKIKCGIEIVKESSRAVTCSFSSIIFPIFPFIIRAVLVLLTIFFLVMAITIQRNEYSVHGELENPDCKCHNFGYSTGGACLPEQFNKDCHTSTGAMCERAVCKLDLQETSNTAIFYCIVIVFSAMWLIAFIQANTKMILAHVFGNWYWNYNQEFIPSSAIFTAMSKIFGNHTGTAAFGSLIITICRILKSLLSKRGSENGQDIGAIIMRVITEMIRACAQVLLDIIEFVSDKAFVCCAIMGTDFWNSVKAVSKIMAKDIPLVVATEYVGNIILFVCKFVAALLSALLFYILSPFKDDQVWITIFIAIVIFVFAYDLADILLTAYDVAIDTLLICGLQDYNQNKTEKAYFQSETLNELLLKKDTA
uniref:Choline transporter-like protein n=1 Tax=Culicoides sonorensis TaxID=179676 RepID=A0A336MPG2_CULSO